MFLTPSISVFSINHAVMFSYSWIPRINLFTCSCVLIVLAFSYPHIPYTFSLTNSRREQWLVSARPQRSLCGQPNWPVALTCATAHPTQLSWPSQKAWLRWPLTSNQRTVCPSVASRSLPFMRGRCTSGVSQVSSRFIFDPQSHIHVGIRLSLLIPWGSFLKTNPAPISIVIEAMLPPALKDWSQSSHNPAKITVANLYIPMIWQVYGVMFIHVLV